MSMDPLCNTSRFGFRYVLTQSHRSRSMGDETITIRTLLTEPEMILALKYYCAIVIVMIIGAFWFVNRSTK